MNLLRSNIAWVCALWVGVVFPPIPARAATTNVTLLPLTNLWRYNQDGFSLGTAWRTNGYDDSAWSNGLALLAKASGPLPGPTNTVLRLTAGPPTHYFRGTFVLNAPTQLLALTATTVLDDGAVIYLNGAEALRVGMAAGAVAFNTVANRSINNAALEGPFPLPVTNVFPGLNHIAVEVHQASPNGGDVAFGLALNGAITYTNAPQMLVALNEVFANNMTRTNAAGGTPDWIELLNRGPAPVDLGGMSLSDDPAAPRRFVFPAGTMIAGGGRLVVEFTPGEPISGTNTGFKLDAGGEAVFLYERPDNGGLLVDALAFGLAAADFSIGRVPDGTGAWTLNQPTPSDANVPQATAADPASLKMNEWLASSSGNADWFELFNPGPLPVALGGLFLTDDSGNRNKFTIAPLSFIGTGQFGFAQFHADGLTELGADHVSFKLASIGGFVGLYTGAGDLIDGVAFGPQATDVSEGRWLDGAANILPFPRTASPGRPNFLPLTNVVINEALTHTDPPLEDAIELRNLTAAPVDISGWHLSNSRDEPRRFRIPTNTVLAPHGFRVFYETNFSSGPAPFTLNSAHGDQLLLSAHDAATNFLGFRDEVVFGAAANGVSFGRHATSTGSDFTAMAERTFGVPFPVTVEDFRNGPGLTNAAPLIGPVVISEIMYHPVRLVDFTPLEFAEDEFIELRNITTNAVPLFDPNYPTNRWRVGGGVEFVFPPALTLAPRAFLVLAGFDPATNAATSNAFAAKYSLPAGVPVLGPWSGRLNNAGERIELFRPDAVQQPPAPDAGFVPQILVDRVVFGATGAWPTNADGAGDSLQRLQAALYGNDPLHWAAAPPTIGASNEAAVLPPEIWFPPRSLVVTQAQLTVFSVIAAGTPPLAYQWRRGGFPLGGFTNATLAINSAHPSHVGGYDVVITNAAGAATSEVVFLSVLVPPAPATFAQGGAGTLAIAAYGTQPLHCHWTRYALPMPNQTNLSLAFPCVHASDAGEYVTLVTNDFNSGVFIAATVNVTPIPAPTLAAPGWNGGPFSASVPTVGCLNYFLERKTALDAPAWSAVTNLAGNGAVRALTDAAPPPGPAFYRVRVD